MSAIDRLIEYLKSKKITAYAFEKKCKTSNGYVMKQQKGKGTINSAVVDRIHRTYPDLNIIWLMSGEGEMIDPNAEKRELERMTLQEDKSYYTKDEIIKHLQERVALLEASLADKEKIIAMLEKQASKKK